MRCNRRRYEVEASRQRGRFTVHVQARTHATLTAALATLLMWQQEGWDRVALVPVDTRETRRKCGLVKAIGLCYGSRYTRKVAEGVRACASCDRTRPGPYQPSAACATPLRVAQANDDALT